ncbi:sulfotransferase [Streptomyces sp. NBC_01142]|uniref:sulfotransferase-like domain-containing protein n=1 Tax=Streptomyces sp. NBC_01142 TaxID=2975865 RepID=UPI00224EFD0E|nr:sulfotransferase family protein [Streptomyces sp. NBC_01142]MCX4820785.1 sulfotransferase [Streptomyces sp. NBC_01142]
MNDGQNIPRVIALWSAPRARSTAFFRSMVERGDLATLHEPFCNLVDFGETTVDDKVVRSDQELIEAMRTLSERQRVFFKDTTDYRYPSVLEDARFLREARHTFLIRHPDEIAASYYALKQDMTAKDIGLEQMYELYRAACDKGDRPVVLDSEDLVRRPVETVAAYCAAVGLPSRPEALNWQPGKRAEWERSDRWHTEVSNSSGFTAKSTEYAATVRNNAMLADFSARHEPFYQALFKERLVVA